VILARVFSAVLEPRRDNKVKILEANTNTALTRSLSLGIMAYLTSHGMYLRPSLLDPRTASTQSLTPSYPEDGQGKKRRLLLVYIHGFIGSEASFHSFPFHVHMKLKERLAATHAIHSKIYPRYKTYKAFHLATNNLSDWLSVHEDPNTDIVLVGHSMGGLLAEEVVLLVGFTKFVLLLSQLLTVKN
jgi:triacylglycerol esterase/lipase EstA (alpha/beta hydrolase family)